MHTWIDERGADKKLTVITTEALYVDENDKADFNPMVQSLEEGASPAAVLSSDCDTILLTSIEKIESQDNDTCVTISYRNGKDDDFEIYYYSTPEVRNEIVAKLRELAGDRFKVYSETHSIPRAIYGSLLTITLTVLFSWILSSAARALQGGESVDTSGRNSFLKRVFVGALDLIGPTGVMLVCWLIVITALFNLYKRASNPPILTVLQSGPYKPPSLIGISVKYLLLAGLVFITARAVVAP